MGGCGGPERTVFLAQWLKELFFKFILWEGVVVLKELILTVSTIGWVWFLRELNFQVYTLGGCGGLERTDF